MSTANNTYTIIGVDLFSIKVKTVDLLWVYLHSTYSCFLVTKEQTNVSSYRRPLLGHICHRFYIKGFDFALFME